MVAGAGQAVEVVVMVVIFALFGGDPGEVAFVVVVVSGVAQLVFRRVFAGRRW